MSAINAAQIKAIHAEARHIGMDEDMRRAFMLREVGKTSCKLMSELEAQKVILGLKKLAGNAGVKARRSKSATVSGKYASILRAMWLNAYHLGVVRNRDDKALIAFAKRQSGADHTQFLTDGKDAAKIIDALKAMMMREANVDWTINAQDIRGKPKRRTELLQRRVLIAQRRMLGIIEAKKIEADQLNAEIARLGALVRKKKKAAV
ncbi:regulatory protein GemA [Bartonella sp. HY761]|uniref:regulatory protein GemA n=1 Tax=Bartonella sp. HY761 TaxID=2979330 RepID=UPI0021FE7031|nr:regulatory protein GemA [Bartonella sp. HY761]UXN07535.1 regulatory protein GemA [Bartonella sp. HY761]